MSAVLDTIQSCASLWFMRATPEHTGGEAWDVLRKWTQSAHQSGLKESEILEALQNGINQGRSLKMFISSPVLG